MVYFKMCDGCCGIDDRIDGGVKKSVEKMIEKGGVVQNRVEYVFR